MHLPPQPSPIPPDSPQPSATWRTYITESGGTGKDKIHISIVSINETNEQIRQRASEGGCA